MSGRSPVLCKTTAGRCSRRGLQETGDLTVLPRSWGTTGLCRSEFRPGDDAELAEPTSLSPSVCSVCLSACLSNPPSLSQALSLSNAGIIITVVLLQDVDRIKPSLQHWQLLSPIPD